MPCRKPPHGGRAAAEAGSRRAWVRGCRFTGSWQQPAMAKAPARKVRAPPTTLSDSDNASTQFVESELEVSDAGSPCAGPSMPATSLGSALHASGSCQPCAWFWKAVGCKNRSECHYCHACPPGELKQRRKAKLAQMQKRARTPEGHTKALQQEREVNGFRLSIKNTFIHVDMSGAEGRSCIVWQVSDTLTAAGLLFAPCQP